MMVVPNKRQTTSLSHLPPTRRNTLSLTGLDFNTRSWLEDIWICAYEWCLMAHTKMKKTTATHSRLFSSSSSNGRASRSGSMMIGLSDPLLEQVLDIDGGRTLSVEYSSLGNFACVATQPPPPETPVAPPGWWI